MVERDPAGDTAFTVEALFHTHRLHLVRLALLLVDDRETAEDVVQDAFAGLYRRWSSLQDEEKALAYLRASVVNGARSVLRRRRTIRRNPQPPIDALTVEPAEDRALLAAEHRAVLAAISRLPQRQREVIVLRYYADLSEADIAEAMGISRGAVKSHASRGMSALRTHLEALA